MTGRKVSVIIPAYNQAEFLGDAIQSVINQTYKNFELVIVNDASTDHTSQVVSHFSDPRIKYLVHGTNKKLPATRNTGIRASTGEVIAFLDADDFYHPQKLEKHMGYLDANPQIGATYNARFSLNHSSNTIRELVRPPLFVGLKDFVLGFPFAPSDMVVQRDWLFRVGLFDETFTNFSEDLDINCQLAMAGCKFASVDHALNYRRYHSGRIINNIPDRLDAALASLRKTFSDPRCSDAVRTLGEKAFANHYLIWAYIAFTQGEASWGQEYILEALGREPSLILGKPCNLIRFFLNNSIADENIDHALHLWQILAQLPRGMEKLIAQYDWAVARGYLLKGIHAVMWGREADGRVDFEQALKRGDRIDEDLLGALAYHLLSYQNEFGSKATRELMRELFSYLAPFGGSQVIRRIFGNYSFNLAFQEYQAGNYGRVFNNTINAFVSQPQYILNRGIWSILLRSISNPKPAVL